MEEEEKKDEKNAYIEKIKAQMHEWDAEIDKLQAKFNKSKAEAKVEYSKAMDSIRARKETTGKKLHELQQSSHASWTELKGGFEKSWTDMKDAIKKAREQFK